MQSVSKAVDKGVLELLRYLILCIEEEVQKDPESSSFSAFLILRLAFSVYQPPKPLKSTIGISLLNALNLNSFVTPNSSPPPAHEDPPSKAMDMLKKKQGKHLLSRDLPTISISDTDEETEEMHFLRRAHQRGRRESSPLLTKRTESTPLLVQQQRDSSPLLSQPTGPPTSSTPSSPNRPKSPTMMDFSAEQDQLVAVSPSVPSPPAGEVVGVAQPKGEVPLPEGESPPTCGGGAVEPGGSRESSVPLESGGEGRQGSLPPTGEEQDEDKSERLSQRESEVSLFQEMEISFPQSSSGTPPFTPSPLFRQGKKIYRQAESFPTMHTRSFQLSPLEASVPPSPQKSQSSDNPESTPDDKLSMPTPSKKALLLSELINSPRFYHPREGQDLTGCMFLYKDLMKGLGHSKNFMLSRHFWNQTFISTLTHERESLGWNEWTVSLYEK